MVYCNIVERGILVAHKYDKDPSSDISHQNPQIGTPHARADHMLLVATYQTNQFT